jgi:ribonucleoside-triphosphate reductase (formate)
MRQRLSDYQQEDGELYNLEATPGEGTAYRFARIDKREFPDLIASGKDEPYYTNSTQLPVDATTDIFEALEHQDDLQTMYTGGTVLHIFLGESLNAPRACRNLVRKIAENYRLPYFTITPTFSICPVHGYIRGEHHTCPYDKEEAPSEPAAETAAPIAAAAESETLATLEKR